MEYSEGRPIGDILRERNIELATNDPVARGGFTQVPNFILRDPEISLGAKVAYSMFLHFAWNNDNRYPAGERRAATESSADARDPMTGPIERAITSNRCRRQPAACSWAIERRNVPTRYT